MIGSAGRYWWYMHYVTNLLIDTLRFPTFSCKFDSLNRHRMNITPFKCSYKNKAFVLTLVYRIDWFNFILRLIVGSMCTKNVLDSNPKNKTISEEIMDEWPMSRRKYIWIQSGVSNNCGISLNTIYILSVVIRDGHCDFSDFQLWLKFSPKTFNPLIETFKINRILYLNCFSTLHDNEHYTIIVFVYIIVQMPNINILSTFACQYISENRIRSHTLIPIFPIFPMGNVEIWNCIIN